MVNLKEQTTGFLILSSVLSILSLRTKAIKKFNHLVNPSIFKDTVGRSFKKYKCNDFLSTNSVYQIVGLYIDNKVFALRNELQPTDYFGTNEDIAVFSLSECSDKNIISGLKNVEMHDNVIAKNITSIRIINENKKIYMHSHLEYDIDLTRAIIFTLASGEEICFEKDSWIFSEEIVINRGHNLINEITSPDVFYKRIAEEPNMKGELTRSEIILT